MNLQSIVITNCIGIALTMLVVYSSHTARKSRTLESRMLTVMLVVLSSCCLMEMVSFLVDGHTSPAARIAAWVSNMWIYLANPGFSVLWLLYTDYHLHRKTRRLFTVYRVHLILLGICWTVILGNIFGGYLFSFTEDNVYYRQPLSYVFFGLPLLVILNSALEVYRYRRCHRTKIFFPIWIFLAPLFAGIILQTLIYGVSVAWCTAAIGLAALYMSMQNELVYRDALTGVFNRHYLDFVLNSWGGNSGIMVDMDYFKEINDHYGHSHGDEALRDLAGILTEAGPDGSVAIRFAGDEFILLLPTNREDEILKTEMRIQEMVDDFNKLSHSPYTLSVSMGHAIFEQVTGDRFLEAIDHAMYVNKQRRHETGLLADRRQGGRPGILTEGSFRFAAEYDLLTGLPNMNVFFAQCEAVKARLTGAGKHAALLYIDLNGMKDYNHKYGFTEGDVLLKDFADRLARIFGKANCCHSGADRFAVAAEAEKLEDRLRHFFADIKQMNRHLPVRVGVYSTEMEIVPAGAAYDRAKIACDTLPLSGESAYRFYNTEIQDMTENRRHIQANLDRAIAERWIQVEYQPIVRAVNRCICHEEALARWVDPEKGMLAPDEFVPYLEAAGLAYRLDLYMVDQVLDKLRRQREEGMNAVPVSINLSRSDFDSCDIVEEIRKRVDEAGEDRKMITIEITESTIGSDFDYMREKVARFRDLGFAVWMDDFGSGYSSLDVLQSIRFDLIKFDMSFMKKLDEGDKGRIILTDLMRMASSLGVDTICEGVETEEQVRFLQEIGCSKLQGFYFFRPLPFEKILDRFREGRRKEIEDPEEAGYFETIGRINLYDLDVIGNMDQDGFQSTFDFLPMGIIEIRGDTSRFVRSNRSYREFISRYFGIDIHGEASREFVKFTTPFMHSTVQKCGEQSGRAFYDEKVADGSIVHSFARKVATNPVTGEIAIVIAVLSISDPSETESYADIARALAADYYNIYVVDMDTDKYIEYTAPSGGTGMAAERRGTDFFADVERDVRIRVYEEDREDVIDWFRKENIVKRLESGQGTYTAVYRLIDTGTPMYTATKVMRLQGTNRVIIGVSVGEMQSRQ